MNKLLLIPLLVACFLMPASAQKKKNRDAKGTPKILYAMPLVVIPGAKQKFTLRGKGLDAVKEVRIAKADGAKVKVLGSKKTTVGNNQSSERLGDSELQIGLDLPNGTKAGATLTAIGPTGESNAYTLLIPDDTPRVAEKEPNDGFAAAQAVAVPAAVEGRIQSDKDCDVFRFDGKKGDKVRIEVQAARFGSPVDALISVYDADRKLLAAADDSDGSPDPIVSLTLPRDGAYFISIIDAHDLGGPQFGYRLVIRK
ncbi:MAG TPA: PPC domain-containing protein [Gemmataceae bacterium]|jgi:hypothetical protein